LILNTLGRPILNFDNLKGGGFIIFHTSKTTQETLDCAQNFIDNGDYDSAVKEYNKAIESDPNNTELYLARGMIYTRPGAQHEQGIKDLTEAIRLDPDCANAYCYRGMAYVLSNQHDQGFQDLNKAIALNPDDAYLHQCRGIANLNFKQYDQAIFDFTKSIILNPDIATSYYFRGNAYRNLSQNDQARNDIEKAISLNLDGSLCIIAEDWLKQISMEDIHECFEEKSGIHKDAGKIKKAIKKCDEILKLNPNDTEWQKLKKHLITLELSINLHESNDYDNAMQAINGLTELINDDSENSSYYYFRGLAYNRTDQNELAKQDLNKSISLEPDDKKNNNNAIKLLAEIELKEQYERIDELNNEEKIEVVLKIIDIELNENPNDIENLYQKADYLSKLNRDLESIGFYDKVIELDSNYKEAYNGKGSCLHQLKMYNEAIIAFEKSIEIDPNYADSYLGKGLCLIALEKKEEAIICFEKLNELDPQDYTAFTLKGMCLADLERYEEAIISYDKALEINPELESAIDCRKLCLSMLGEQKSNE